jgi:hypothetical protein
MQSVGAYKSQNKKYVDRSLFSKIKIVSKYEIVGIS